MFPSSLRSFALGVATLCFAVFSQAATVTTLAIHSEAMNQDFPALVAVPDTYAKTETAFPVVYMLHGFSGKYDSWNGITPLGELADRFNMILVCPDGAFDSWYFDIPSDPKCRFETYISKEVVGYIDHNYRTIPSPKGRAITGLSMGGHGAMFLALRHKDVFGAAGSMSGGLDIRPFPNNWNISKHIGTITEHPEQWEQLTAINNLGKLENGQLALTIDCGVDDFFIQVNRDFHQALLKQKINHDYTERPGAHTGVYWANSLPYHLLFFQRFFAQPVAAK
jgi:S-formylglutathione hydrolase FrmB